MAKLSCCSVSLPEGPHYSAWKKRALRCPLRTWNRRRSFQVLEWSTLDSRSQPSFPRGLGLLGMSSQEQPSGPYQPEGLDRTSPEAGVGWHRLEVILETPWLVQQARPEKRALSQGFLTLCFLQAGKLACVLPIGCQHQGEGQEVLWVLQDRCEPRDSP